MKLFTFPDGTTMYELRMAIQRTRNRKRRRRKTRPQAKSTAPLNTTGVSAANAERIAGRIVDKALARSAHGRPSTFEHPLAAAARAGRRSLLVHYTGARVLVTPTEPFARRAFYIARWRKQLALGRITPTQYAEKMRLLFETPERLP